MYFFKTTRPFHDLASTVPYPAQFTHTLTNYSQVHGRFCFRTQSHPLLSFTVMPIKFYCFEVERKVHISSKKHRTPFLKLIVLFHTLFYFLICHFLCFEFELL